MLPKFLRFQIGRWRYPELADFLDMGLGIEAREARSRKHWSRHLSLSKEFQVKVLNSWPNVHQENLAILGSGRLLDVPCQDYVQNFSEIFLYDADPEALRAKNAWASQISSRVKLHFKLGDLTSSLTAWTRSLEEFLSRHSPDKTEDLCNFLSEFNVHAPIELPKMAAIVSLNIFSQIPVYWQERAHKLLKKLWKLEPDEQGNFEAPLQQALESTFRKLQTQHLDMLCASAAKLVVIIADSKFMYYQRHKSPWLVEPAIFVPKLNLPGYNQVARDTWFWHVAPQGIENQDYGVIHQVEALAFNLPA